MKRLWYLPALLSVACAILAWPALPTPIAQAQTQSGKSIVVSLSQQELTAYNGSQVLLQTPVSTGQEQDLPTPTGQFSIYAKQSPFEFISPWPPGSPYYYAPISAQYVMEFSPQYYIHDASWRSVWGPASQQGGPPGTAYGGSHGCVETPPSEMSVLYSWAPIGTPVTVEP